MKIRSIRNTAIAAIAGIGIVLAGAFAAPEQAHAGHKGKVAAAIVGGLVVGAIIGAHSRPAHAGSYGVYHAPRYHAPRYHVRHQHCYWTRQKVWHPYHGYYSVRKVRVCH